MQSASTENSYREALRRRDSSWATGCWWLLVWIQTATAWTSRVPPTRRRKANCPTSDFFTSADRPPLTLSNPRDGRRPLPPAPPGHGYTSALRLSQRHRHRLPPRARQEELLPPCGRSQKKGL